MHIRLAAALAVLGLLAATPATAANFQISAGTSSGSFLGDSIGLDFRSGTLLAAWTDNSDGLAGNPDRPSFDIGFARIVSGAVGANVNVTATPLSQMGVSLAADPTNPDTLVAAALDGTSEPSAMRAFSRDGGTSWTTVRGLPGNFGGFSPSVACDAFGNCFLALINDPDFFNPRLELSLSTDGGATFAPLPLPDLPGLQTSVSVTVGFGAVWLVFEGYDGSPRIQTLAAPVTGRGEIGAFSVQTLPGTTNGSRPDIALRPGGAAVVS
jgi:hypothetical protein